MTELFSLVRQAWIPVALRSGRRVFVRPCDISSPYEGEDIVRVSTGRPDCDISLTELLIGLLAVGEDGTGRRDWPQRFRTPPSRQELEDAFAPFEKALILDGEGPRFLQDLEPLDGDPTPVAALLIDAPGAKSINDNADHFVKRGRTGVLSRSSAAIVLATLQTTAPSGGAGHRTSLRGGGPLTTLVIPGCQNGEPTLWQLLWANVPDDAKPGESVALDHIFPWLAATRTSDPKSQGRSTVPDADAHRAQAFFGMPRRIRLIFEGNPDRRPCDLTGVIDDVIVTGYVTRPWGTNYEGWDRAHPLSPYYKPKATATEILPVHLQSARVSYRDYLGLAFEAGEQLEFPAAAVSSFTHHRSDAIRQHDGTDWRRHRLLAAGYAMDNMKPLDFAEALLPLVVTGSPEVDGEVVGFARRFVGTAEEAAKLLVAAVKRGLYGDGREIKWDSVPLVNTRERFWSETEQDFYGALRGAADAMLGVAGPLSDQLHTIAASTADRWLAVLRRACLSIFDDTVPIEDAESARIADVIAGRRLLTTAFSGNGPAGRRVFGALGKSLPESATASRKGKRRAA